VEKDQGLQLKTEEGAAHVAVDNIELAEVYDATDVPQRDAVTWVRSGAGSKYVRGRCRLSMSSSMRITTCISWQNVHTSTQEFQ